MNIVIYIITKEIYIIRLMIHEKLSILLMIKKSDTLLFYEQYLQQLYELFLLKIINFYPLLFVNKNSGKKQTKIIAHPILIITLDMP